MKASTRSAITVSRLVGGHRPGTLGYEEGGQADREGWSGRQAVLGWFWLFRTR